MDSALPKPFGLRTDSLPLAKLERLPCVRRKAEHQLTRDREESTVVTCLAGAADL